MIRFATLTALFLGFACAAPGHPPGRDGAAPVEEETTMNGTDSSTASGPGRRTPRPYLPRIVRLVIERVPFEPPSYKFVQSAYADLKEALAFTIQVTGELPLERDATPVLYVGTVELSHAESLGEHRYRYLAFPAEEEAMREGAPITLGWPGERPHAETRFRYEREKR